MVLVEEAEEDHLLPPLLEVKQTEELVVLRHRMLLVEAVLLGQETAVMVRRVL